MSPRRPDDDDAVFEPPAAIKEALDRVVRSLGAPGTDAVEQVFGRWHEVVGTVLAARTRPVKIDDGRLLLEADENAVVSHVRYLEATMIERLDDLLGPGRVTAVDVRVTPIGRRGKQR